MDVLIRFVTGLAMVALVGFGYVAWHEWSYWSSHGHNELAGVLAVAGASGAALALGVLIVSFALDRDGI
jgi:hypothetical protein